MNIAEWWSMRLLLNKIYIAIAILACSSHAQTGSPERFLLRSSPADTFLSQGLTSNVVAEVKLMGDTLTWFGTGQGLALFDGNTTYHHNSTTDSLIDGQMTKLVPNGGIPAVSILNNTMAVAFSGDNGTIQVGYGLVLTNNAQAISDSGGIDWKYLKQPMDKDADTLRPFGEGFFRSLPVTVPEANVTYDAFLNGNYLWTASWAGGLRRYNLNDENWEIVPLPLDEQRSLSLCTGFDETDDLGRAILPEYYLNPRDPADGGNHNHKAFSVLISGDTIWAGTANGINRGLVINEWQETSPGNFQLFDCIEWEHYSYPNDNLTGNFVVGLAKQVWNGLTTIWAATINADTPGEMRGLSYTRDGGSTWETTLHGERVYNITAHDSIVLASSQTGLWKSHDGENWALYKPAIDTTLMSQSQILTDLVYTSTFDDRDSVLKLWVGTSNGAALSSDIQGSSWTIFQTEYDSMDFYAYPNPFSPLNHNQLGGEGYVRFHTGVIVNTQIELDIYNFAMEKVFQQNFNLNTYNGALKWNGRDLNGAYVDNGVYFIRMKYSPSLNESPQYFWDKLIVVK